VKIQYIFILFCLAAFARIPTAAAYSAIALAEGSTRKGAHYEVMDYEHHSAPRDVVEKRAIEGCNLEGGINPRIVLSTGKPGYFAIADSRQGQARVIGWAGPLSTPEAAAKEAIENCRKRGGADARLHAQWADGVQGKRS
jgi:Domain of unknown function (DUF4189)